MEGALVGIVGTRSYVFASGLATAARAAIEEAMQMVYSRMANDDAELVWAGQDRDFVPRFRVVPLQDPTWAERAVGRAGLWLADLFRL